MYGKGPYARPALESLLGQTCDELAVVITDDGGGSRDGLLDLLSDRRVTYRLNGRRLGLTKNWRRAYELARELHPEAPYFAWGSDHDLWNAEWLEMLSSELEQHSEAVLAYGLRAVLSDEDQVLTRTWRFETSGAKDPRARLTQTTQGMAAGYMIYGLFRSNVPAGCGIFRSVLMPDRLLLSEASVLGTFHQADEALWYRRKDTYSAARQRSALFPNRIPAIARVPWWVSHPLVFAAVQLRSRRNRRDRLYLTATHWLGTLRFVRKQQVRVVHRWFTRRMASAKQRIV